MEASIRYSLLTIRQHHQQHEGQGARIASLRAAINLPLQLSVTTEELWDVTGNKPGCGIVVGEAADVAFEKPT